MNILKKTPLRILAIGMMFAAVLAITGATSWKDRDLFSKTADDVVYYIPQFTNFTEISTQEMHFLRKTLDKAKENNVKAVIFEIDTPGGSVKTAYEYASILAKSKVPVIAYVNPHGISAGMIIALAANRIAIDPAGIIGDAMPIQMTSGGIVPIVDQERKHERENQDKEEEKESNKSEEVVKKDEKKEADKDKKKEADKDKKKEADKDKKKEIKPDEVVIDKLKKEVKKLKDKLTKKKYKSTDKDLASQKFLTVFFKKLETYAEKNDRPKRVVRAMADPYQKLTLKRDGIDHSRISPLTLSAKEAKKLKVVDYICDSREELMEKLGLGNCKVEVIKKSPVDQLVSFLTHPAIAGILIALGLIGLYVEIKIPGFGVSGILGVTALTLFFLGHVGSGASEWGPVVIFFVGMVLLALEIFVIPGFGIVGLLGITCIVISFFAAFGFKNFAAASQTVSYSLLGALVTIILLTIYVLPKSSIFKWIRLDTVQKHGDGYNSHKDVSTELLHQTGIAHTTLRPVGTVMINEKIYEATTQGAFIEKGEAVEIIEATRMKITVKKV
jgi:membrane-bound serine protease (ClpP class)